MHIDADHKLDHLTVHDLLSNMIAICGTTGSGKSTTVAVLLEEMLALMPFAIIDPHGEYYTLREKFPLLIVGRSDNADYEITPAQAAVAARYAYEQRRTVILDLYRVTDEAERLAYVEHFIGAIWRLARAQPQGKQRPFGVVIDEAHNFIPETLKPLPAQKKLLEFATEGRKFGFLVIASEQRPSRISKTFLGMCSKRFFHRVSDFADVKAYADRLAWSAAETKKHVTTLKTGQAVFRTADQQVIVQIRERHTSHGGASPTLDGADMAALPAGDTSMIEALRALFANADEGAAAADNPETVEALRTELAQLQARIDELTTALAKAGVEAADWQRIAQERHGVIDQLNQPPLAPEAPARQLELLQVGRVDAQQVTVKERQTTTTTTTTVEREVAEQHISSRSLTILQNRQNKKFDELLRDVRMLSPRLRQTLAYLFDKPGYVNVSRIARELDYEESNLQKQIHSLKRLGLVVQEGYRSTRWRSNLQPFIDNEFPNLDRKVLIERLWKVVAA